MIKLWHALGKVAFWVSLPALFVYLLNSKRTRIVIIVDQDVLVVRGWLGGGSWGLPGGGLHRKEKPEDGAVRELKEETGIEVSASKLQKLYFGKMKSEHGLRYTAYAYGLKLSKKPDLTRQKFELTHLDWINSQELVDDPRTAEDVRVLVRQYLDT